MRRVGGRRGWGLDTRGLGVGGVWDGKGADGELVCSIPPGGWRSKLAGTLSGSTGI